MAPTKPDKAAEKEAKLTPEQSANLMLDYLRKQNRPYSATDISANLKNRVTKAAAAKLLKDMHERGDIEGKAAGKQVVYHAIQDEADEADVSALQALDDEATRLRDEVTALKNAERELRAALRTDTVQDPLPELKATVAALEEQKAGMLARLKKLRGGDVKPISAEEKDMITKEWKKWKRCAGERRRIRKEVWAMIVDAVPKEKAESLKEDFGFE